MDSRKVLEQVPRVGFYHGGPRPPEDDTFPACLGAFLEYVGDDLGFRRPGSGEPWHHVHTFLMCVSGAAFRVVWNEEKPDPSAMSLTMARTDPLAPIRDAFEAIGYTCEVLLRGDYARSLGIDQGDDVREDEMRDRIVQSIEGRGWPVLSIGVVGPPEFGLIAGYDDCGDTLVGWSFFQDSDEDRSRIEFEPSGMYRKRDWYAQTNGIVVVTGKCERPPMRETYRKILTTAVEMLRTPKVRGHLASFAAYTAWADQLLEDSLYEGDGLKDRHRIHSDTLGGVAEARAWGSWFLEDLVRDECDAAEDLSAAKTCFDDIHDLVWAAWEFTNDRGPVPGVERFADPGIRGRLVPLIRLMRTRDEEAADFFDRALDKMGARSDSRNRLVLEGVPRIGYDVRLCPFVGSLSAALEYAGHPVDYDRLMGATGAAFRRFYEKNDGGNVDLMYLGQEPILRASEAVGYRLVPIPYDRERMIGSIRRSLERDRPVLAFGMIGPPEAGLVTGYDAGGDILIGWSYFQEDRDAYYRKERWFEECSQGPFALVLVEDRRRWPGPPRRRQIENTLRWAVDLERTPVRPEFPGHASGLAACLAWADQLLVDDDYQSDDPQVLETRGMVHCDQCTMLYERLSAAAYLRQIALEVPEVSTMLQAAADRFEQTAAQGETLWPWGHMNFAEVGGQMRDRSVRESMAAKIREAAHLEDEATQHLEHALQAMVKE